MMVINMTNVVALIGVIQKAYYDKQKDSYFVDLKLEKTIKNEAGTIEFETYKVKLWKGCYHDISSLSSFKPDLILGVKGRLEKDGEEVYVVAEKISFLGKNK